MRISREIEQKFRSEIKSIREENFLFFVHEKKKRNLRRLHFFSIDDIHEIRDISHFNPRIYRYRVELSSIDIYRISETRDPCYPTPMAYCCVPLVQPETCPSP